MQSHLEQCRYNMVEQQIRPWDVLDDKVLSTLETIPRDQYVPEEYRNLAYADTAIPLNTSAHMMHPIIEGRLLQVLDIQPEDKVLEIGTGSAYLTACLAHMACYVESIEIDEALHQQAQKKLQQAGIENIELRCGNGLELNHAREKYDIIIATGSLSDISDELKQALKFKGRLFAVTGEAPAMQAHLITRTAENDWADECIFETILPPLVHGEKPVEFEF